MRLLVWCGIYWFAFAAAVCAAPPEPAELPPRDFAGAQYIDSAGCVFLREGRGWTAALTDEQVQVCGFPPSRGIWADRAPGTSPRTPGEDAAAIERDLLLLTVTSDGTAMALDDSADTSAADRKAVPAPASGAGAAAVRVNDAQDDPGAEIMRGLAARRQVGALRQPYANSDARLCGLLGLQRAGDDPASIADDPTGGLCSGRAVKLGGFRASDVDIPAPAEQGAAAATDAAGTIAPAVAPKRVSAAGETQTDPSLRLEKRPEAESRTMPAPSAQGSGRDQARGRGDARTSQANVELIGPDARFVQIGRFDPPAAEIAARALVNLGYPAVRESRLGKDGKRFVMAGPFPTRAALVAALDRLRKAGYSRAVAR